MFGANDMMDMMPAGSGGIDMAMGAPAQVPVNPTLNSASNFIQQPNLTALLNNGSGGLFGNNSPTTNTTGNPNTNGNGSSLAQLLSNASKSVQSGFPPPIHANVTPGHGVQLQLPQPIGSNGIAPITGGNLSGASPTMGMNNSMYSGAYGSMNGMSPQQMQMMMMNRGMY